MQDRERALTEIRSAMQVLTELKAQFKIAKNSQDCDPTLFVGVTDSDMIDPMSAVIEKFFGAAYKPRGQSAFWKNWFDSFVKNCGGCKSDQVLFRKNIEPEMDLFIALWPWGSNPIKTSVRIGLICANPEDEEELGKNLKGVFV